MSMSKSAVGLSLLTLVNPQPTQTQQDSSHITHYNSIQFSSINNDRKRGI